MYIKASTQELMFILWPTNIIVEVMTGIKSVHKNNDGFFYSNLNIIINKSCSGFNFFMICFLMLSFSAINVLKTHKQIVTAIVLPLFISTISTVFANSSRILIAIYVKKIMPDSSNKYPWLHQTEGIIVYLFLLIIIHTSFTFLIQKIQDKNEELT